MSNYVPRYWRMKETLYHLKTSETRTSVLERPSVLEANALNNVESPESDSNTRDDVTQLQPSAVA